jgi:hypothetical protein
MLRFLLVFLFSSVAWGFDHQYIMTNRSSITTDTWFSESIGSSVGKISSDVNQDPEVWRGFFLRSEIGMETMKFFQFSTGVEISRITRQDHLDRIEAIKTYSEAKMVFSAPMLNVEVGGGVVLGNARYAIINATDMNVSGYYYTLGINRYITSNLSFFTRGNAEIVRMKRTGGDPNLKSAEGTINSGSMGIRIFWTRRGRGS